MSERRVLVIAGEASGDRHAAGLVREALALDPGLRFYGIGGAHLRAAGAEIVHDAAELAVVGIAEVWEQLPALRAALADMKRRVREDRPDALLLVDFPDFNLMVAKVAAGLGIPVVYFVSPQVWAWRRGRVRVIRRRVARMLVIFPFEETFYRGENVPVTFVGHPLADDVPAQLSPAEARARLGLEPDQPVYGLLPGSRRGEVQRLLEPLFATARAILAKEPRAAFLVPVADTLDFDAISEATLRTGLPAVALRGAFELLVAACDAAVAASGTVTLELALRGVPPVVVYKTSALSYLVARLAVRVKHISLVNLVAGRQVVPELVQDAFTPGRAADEALALGRPGPARDAVLAGLAAVRASLGSPGAYRRAARAFLETLDGARGAADNRPHDPKHDGLREGAGGRG